MCGLAEGFDLELSPLDGFQMPRRIASGFLALTFCP